MTSDVLISAPVTPAIVRAFLDRARGHGYTGGVLGIRGRPEGAADFRHDDQPVHIAPAASSLAMREAIRDWSGEGWLVVVTDRPDGDLGEGLLSQLTYQSLRHPDPWQGVQQRFGAHCIDGRLLRLPDSRALASGLLEVAPVEGWPPAAAGVLTRDHALSCVARETLDLPDGPIDLIAVLQWSTGAELPGSIARLRSRAGDVTADAVLAWIAEAAGEAALFVAALFRAGTPNDLVPLGLVLDCLLEAKDRQQAEVAIARLQYRWGDVARPALLAAARLSGIVVAGLLGGRATQAAAQQLLARADDLVAEAQAEHLTAQSRLLRGGLTLRLRALAEVLRAVPAVDAVRLQTTWTSVAEHELADDPRVAPAAAGVRLARWLSMDDSDVSGATLAELSRLHLTVDAWVDSAVNDADTGVDEPVLAAALERVLRAVEERRDAHDLAFAVELARSGVEGRPVGVLVLERVLPDVVLPLAQQYPSLLLVLDGMSAGVATEILSHATGELEFGMVESLVPGTTHRTPALTVLPSVTEFSRTSLLSGRLARGQQADERRNFAEATRALPGTVLFHKGGLDASRPGFALADEARQAIADTDQHRLVACVLNTIDDALDRTDPGGTDWTAEAVKHLAPLLRAARRSGRLVILTSDHGHVVERRRGTQRGIGLGNRYRAANAPVAPDEVLVEGSRVLAPGGSAVLAVNERLRYGPLKAGYHGGAAPAEAVVPVALLAPTSLTNNTLTPAPIAEPSWWDLTRATTTASLVVTDEPAPTAAAPQPDLFAAETAPQPSGVAVALLATSTYREQRKLAGRIAISDEAVASLVEALAAAPDRRLPAARVAALLGVALTRVTMVMSQVATLLNVEGYPVIATDPATQAVSLDGVLFAEQFGVRI